MPELQWPSPGRHADTTAARARAGWVSAAPAGPVVSRAPMDPAVRVPAAGKDRAVLAAGRDLAVTVAPVDLRHHLRGISLGGESTKAGSTTNRSTIRVAG